LSSIAPTLDGLLDRFRELEIAIVELRQLPR
jgi:hypothetical protein